MKINEKGVKNSYLSAHLFGKGISVELILHALDKGTEEDMGNYGKPGSRYFKLELPDGAGLPGRFVLPEEDGVYGGKIANWNASCQLKFRHGKLSPILKKAELPAWMIQYASCVWVIVEKNQLEDGKLQLEDGPTEADPEESWIVCTAHFGPPSRLKPRLPKKGASADDLLRYLDQLDSWTREQERVVFVDLEADGVEGLPPKAEASAEEIQLLMKKLADMQEEIRILRGIVRKK